MVAVNYLWDDEEDNIIREYDDAGNTIVEYTTEPALYGNVVSQNRGGTTSYLHFDALGNTTEVTNSAGVVTDRIRYSAFGEVTERTGTTEVPLQYVGQKGYYRDGVTGDYLVRRRAMPPSVGRWLSCDPLSTWPASSLQGTAYVYAVNSPSNRLDPTGLWVDMGNNIFMASFVDTFEDLVKRVAPNLAPGNKVCIIPVDPGDAGLRALMASEWECQRPLVCAQYDVSNLVDALPVGNAITAAIGSDINGYIAGATAFYRAKPMTAKDFLSTVAANASTGRTPLKSITIIGHGQKLKDRIGGDLSGVPESREVVTLDLRDIDKWPTFDDALAGRHPRLCWYRTDAKVRLVGCNTSAFATHIAGALRGSAAAFGTTRPTWAVDVATMGWGDLKGLIIVPDPAVGTAKTPDAYHAMKFWHEAPASYGGAGSGKVPAKCRSGIVFPGK